MQQVTLPPMPSRIANLRRDERGYPVPYFVAWIDGKPDFRVVHPDTISRCVRRRLCWICGEPMKATATFVLGPMCMVNRTNAEPPSHLECARFAAIACPFLTKPKMKRNEHDLPEGHREMPGMPLKRNPGCCIVWQTERYSLFQAGNGMLFDIGTPILVECYAEGRKATREEVLESISTGIPLLQKVAEEEGPRAVRELERARRKAEALLV